MVMTTPVWNVKEISDLSFFLCNSSSQQTFKTKTEICCASRADPRGAIAHPETYGSNIIRHNFVQVGKLHSRYKAILSSTALSQQCCEAHFTSLTVAKLLWAWLPTVTEIAPSTLTGWIRPCCAHGRRRDFFPGGPLGDFSKIFPGGQKWWNLLLSHSK